MSQPEWVLVYATDYSALYRDATGVYDPELAILEEIDDAPASERFQVYRASLERCYQATRDDGSTFLVSVDPARTDLPHPIGQYVPWFADDLGNVARSVGGSVDDLVSALCSDDPATLAEAYEAIAGYHGWDNLDSYPDTWSARNARSWPDCDCSVATDDDPDDE